MTRSDKARSQLAPLAVTLAAAVAVVLAVCAVRAGDPCRFYKRVVRRQQQPSLGCVHGRHDLAPPQRRTIVSRHGDTQTQWWASCRRCPHRTPAKAAATAAAEPG